MWRMLKWQWIKKQPNNILLMVGKFIKTDVLIRFVFAERWSLMRLAKCLSITCSIIFQSSLLIRCVSCCCKLFKLQKCIHIYLNDLSNTFSAVYTAIYANEVVSWNFSFNILQFAYVTFIVSHCAFSLLSTKNLFASETMLLAIS